MDRLANDPRDLHLRHAQALTDLGLGEVEREAQVQHHSIALGEDPEQVVDHRTRVGAGEFGVLPAAHAGPNVVVAILGTRSVERVEPMRRAVLIFDGSDPSTYIVMEPGADNDEILGALGWSREVEPTTSSRR